MSLPKQFITPDVRERRYDPPPTYTDRTANTAISRADKNKK